MISSACMASGLSAPIEKYEVTLPTSCERETLSITRTRAVYRLQMGPRACCLYERLFLSHMEGCKENFNARWFVR